MTYKNRIVGHDEIDPEQLLANPLNWRIHPEAQQLALEGVLDEVGWVDEIIVNQKTGYVVDGHLRVALAIRNEQPLIPVKYVDLNAEEEAIVLATIDPLAAMAVTDHEKLAEVLDQIDRTDLDDLLKSAVKYVNFVDPKDVEFPEITDDEPDEYVDCPKCGHRFKPQIRQNT